MSPSLCLDIIYQYRILNSMTKAATKGLKLILLAKSSP